MFWKLTDDCPHRECCEFEMDATISEGFVRAVRWCQFHRRLLDGGMTPAELFVAIRQMQQARSKAQDAIKDNLMARGLLTEEDPMPPATIDALGNYHISVGALIDADMLAQVATEVEKFERAPGMGAIIVE